MKFGVRFQKMFAMFPDIDRAKIVHNRVTKLTRPEMYEILRGMKASGIKTPAQPTRTGSEEMRSFIFTIIDKNVSK